MNNTNKKFNLDILTKLGTHHKTIMELVKSNINSMNTNKELYNFVNNYLIEHSINKAFPIGISINEIIAHDSYHKERISPSTTSISSKFVNVSFEYFILVNKSLLILTGSVIDMPDLSKNLCTRM